MNLKRLSDLRKEDNSKCKYIYLLIGQGKLKGYEKDGYLYYDEDEFNTRKGKQRLGRPLKVKATKITIENELGMDNTVETDELVGEIIEQMEQSNE